jgi:small nuclear ribonucleoprotein (snRNP)-like protein
MAEPRPLDNLNGMIGKLVNVTLKNGLTYKGNLKSFDLHINIVLDNCKERKSNTIFITGHSVEECLLSDDSIDQ